MQCRGRCNACGAAIPYHACRNCMQAASSCLSCASCTRAYDAKVVHKPPLAASHVLQNSERAKFQRAETHGYTFTKCGRILVYVRRVCVGFQRRGVCPVVGVVCLLRRSVGLAYGLVSAALLPAVGACVVLVFGAMPGR